MFSVRQHLLFDPSPAWSLVGRALKARSFILVLVLGGSITSALAFISRPIYRSEAALLYQDRSGPNPAVPQSMSTPSPRRIAVTLREMLLSRTLLEKLVAEFGLYGKTVARSGLAAAAEEMQERDLHLAIREGYSFRISFDSTSPELAQRVAARATELLLQARASARADEARETERFLDGEKRRVEQELHKRESELALFAAQNPGVVEIGPGRTRTEPSDGAAAGSLGLETQAQELRKRLAAPGVDDQEEARLLQQIELLEKQMRAVRRPRSHTSPATEPSTLARLRTQYLELERRLRESREHLALLASRQFQAEMQARFATQTNRADLVVVAPASKPVAPLRSPRFTLIALGSVVSLLSALSVGLLFAIRDDRLRSAVDLRRFGLPPLLCEVPPSDSSW